MIRVIILLIFVFLVWVLYASGFDKKKKIRISIIAVVLCAIAFWFDGYDKRELRNFVEVGQVASCGVSGGYSYRTNFDLTICVQNNAEKGTLSRLNIAVIASTCDAQQCTELQRVERSLLVDIAPNTRRVIEQNLSFDNLKPEQADIQWSIEVLETKAHR